MTPFFQALQHSGSAVGAARALVQCVQPGSVAELLGPSEGTACGVRKNRAAWLLFAARSTLITAYWDVVAILVAWG